MNERRGAAPVFVLRVRVEHLRQELRRAGVRQQAVGHSRFGIALGEIGERKDVRRIKEVEIRMAISRWLGEPMIEAAAAGARDVCNHAVEDLALTLVAVESVIQIRAKEA